MPVRKINYSGRKPLKASDIPIHVVSNVFNVNLQNIGDFGLPLDSLIVVEPYKNARRLRVHYGTVENAVTPSEDKRRLFEFSEHENVLFRVKIVEKNSGKILAEAKIAPHIDGNPPKEKSLLPVKGEDDIEECWRIDFEGDVPVLLIDKTLGRIEQSDHFSALVYPAVLREILAYILFVEEHHHTEDNTRSSQWLRFAKSFDSNIPNFPNENDESGRDFEEESWEWIESVAIEFARQLESLKKGKRIFSEE